MSNLSQEMFDRVVTALAAQGGPSLNETNECQYRGPGGRKCAAGIEIADEEYLAEYEGWRLTRDSGPGFCPTPFPSRLLPFTDLLHALQSAHDYSKFDGDNGTATWADPWRHPRGIARNLRNVADGFHLNPAAIEAAFPRPAAP